MQFTEKVKIMTGDRDHINDHQERSLLQYVNILIVERPFII